MAAIERTGGALEVLTAAALLLPGLAGSAHAQSAETPSVAVQFSRYRDAPRPVADAPNTARPLGAVSLVFKASRRLPDGDGLSITLSQDTWSGATPIAAAPRSAAGNRPILGTGAGGALLVVGASPMLTGSVLLDRARRPVTVDPASGRLVRDDQVVHTLASASPETRQQLDARWSHRLEEGASGLGGGSWSWGGGLSDERDFRSRFVNAERRVDLNDALTTLTLGASRTRSEIAATLDHDAAPYLTKTLQAGRLANRGGHAVLQGRRDEASLSAGLFQVLGRGAVMEGRATHTRQRGSLSDPYRATSVIFAPGLAAAGSDPVPGNLQALLEQRPDTRRQTSLDGKLILHVPRLDAALHLGAGHYRDDWGLRARRLEAEWFQPLPQLARGALASARLKRYTQGAAAFYTPYLVSAQAYRQVSIGPDGQPVVRSFDPAQLPAHFSSDPRLAAFRATTIGLGLSMPIGRDLTLELGAERTRQAGVLDGGAAHRYTTAHAGLGISFDDAAASARAQASPAAAHAARAGHEGHAGGGGHGAVVPAGLTVHAPGPAGSIMLGYRIGLQRDGGAPRRGTAPTDDATLTATACAPAVCATRPVAMRMTMHMLHIGYSVDDAFGLMVMPQYMTMRMDSRLLPSSTPADPAVHFGRHESGAVGDTALLATVALNATPASRWLLTLGVSAPTGKTDLRHRRSHQADGGAMDIAMQTGSGTWDLLPGVAWLGQSGRFSGGLQLGGTRRLGTNADGYALGDRWQAAGWAGWRIAAPLTVTARLSRTVDGAIRGDRRDAHPTWSPADHIRNHGGRLDELGLGLAIDRLPGAYAGTSLSLEWTHALRHAVRGVQLPRRGGLALNFSHHF
ncbi:DUF3570 domain-containing protein [Aquabacterium humicola]|uniref:DUF3570 domain-containing protein n=1 Tax=Aquabacterium humicola TaxID=3237377 RepID=UPI002542E64B|nr:DUF3570 domain-containing protein [Rubrivivax pictus]